MRPFGVSGEMRLRPLAEDPRWYFDLDPDRVFLLREDSLPRPVRVAFQRQHGEDVIVKIEGIDSPELAQELTGRHLAIPEGDRPALGEDRFYTDELIGLQVVDRDGETLGRVHEVIDSAREAYLSVKGGSQDFLVPPERALIESVDLQARQIRLRFKFHSPRDKEA